MGGAFAMPDSTIHDESLAGTRVLVAEDEPLLLMLLTDMLADLGCRVICSATQLALAMQYAAGNDVDVAILDVKLGDVDVKPLVDVFEARAVPVVLATGYGSVAGKRFPNSVLMSKPYTLESLRTALERALASKPHED